MERERILKLTLKKERLQSVLMPVGAEIISVQVQNNLPTIWARCKGRSLEKRLFAIYATGEELPDNPGEHLATLQLFEGYAIFHLFELGNS